MRLLVSGITNWEEAWYAVNRGAHALGFIFEPHSPRYINPELARAIILRLPPLVSTVGVFKDTPRYTIQELTTFCRLDWLLFLGQENPKECKDYHQPIIKYLPKLSCYQEYETVTAFLVEKGEVPPNISSSEFPYIIYKGCCLEYDDLDAYGLYLAFNDEGTIDGYLPMDWDLS